MKVLLFLVSFFFTSISLNAQYSTREISKKKQDYTDSLKQVEYKYILPILGQKVYKAGFDIPYPVGIMANYIAMTQGVLLNNMQLGLKTDSQDIPLTNVDEFIIFGDNKNDSYSVNVRPDIWVFPFLNLYGVFGRGQSETTVQLKAPVEFVSSVKQSVSTAGVGIMGAFGIGPLWTSVDANWTWNKPELLDQAVLVKVIGIRLGKTFEFDQHPDRNIAFWGGGMRVRMQSETAGQIQLIDALPAAVWDKKDEFVADYNTWYSNLDPIKKGLVNQTPIPDIVDRVDQADGTAIIRYAMDKQVAQEWNGGFGAQFQYSKRWMLRTEWMFIGDRKSGLLSLNYRFLL